jgi:hypothetical protein
LTLQVTCLDDFTFSDVWPTCANSEYRWKSSPLTLSPPVTQCPEPTSLNYTEDIETTWTLGDSIDYLANVT